MNFWKLVKELRRRRVFRVAGIYLIGAWAWLQVMDVIVEPAGLPAWSMTLLLYVEVLLFPVAVFLGWRYQITDHGLVRTTSEVGRDEEPLRLGPPDYAIFAGLALMLAVAGYGLLGGDDPFLNLEDTVQQTQSQVGSQQEEGSDSIAVLPFVDLSAAGDQEYFGDGLADTLSQVLAQIHGLKVAARTSAFAFKGTDMPLGKIATALAVTHILEGTIQAAGSQLRVGASLVEAASGKTLLSRTFDGSLEDVFNFQDEITREVVAALKIELLQSDQTRLDERYRPNLEAYDQFVLGRHEMGKGTVAGLQAAVGHFERASELDPDYPLPYVYLADTHRSLEIYAFGFQDSYSALPTPWTEALQRPLLEKALELDSGSGEAIAGLASIERDEEKAEEGFVQAIELNPNNTNAYYWFSKFLSLNQGRYDEALEQIEKAVELDPLSDIIQYEYAKALWATGRIELAMSTLLDNVKRNPDFPYNYKLMTRWKLQTGNVGDAMRWIKALRKLEPDSPSHWGEFGGECHLYELLDDREASFQCFSEFAAAYPDTVTARPFLAEREAIEAGEVEDYEHFGIVRSERALDVYRSLVADEPGNGYRANQLGFALEQAGRSEELLEMMERAHPELFEDPPIVSGATTWPAMMTAHALLKTGETEQANLLLDGVENAISGLRLITGPGFTNGIENVEVAALRGDKEEALSGLRRAIDQNWKFTWDWMEFNKYLDPIRDDPRYIAMYEELQADIARQRAWYERNKDLPLY